jgi:hypothetical protein
MVANWISDTKLDGDPIRVSAMADELRQRWVLCRDLLLIGIGTILQEVQEFFS